MDHLSSFWPIPISRTVTLLSVTLLHPAKHFLCRFAGHLIGRLIGLLHQSPQPFKIGSGVTLTIRRD
jgi:hypothetical protein